MLRFSSPRGPLVVAIATLMAVCYASATMAQSQSSPQFTQDYGFRLDGALPAPNDGSHEEGSGAPEDGASAKPQPGGAKRAHEAQSDDLANKLNNPGSDLAYLNFKLSWSRFTGDLPDSSSQDSTRT